MACEICKLQIFRRANLNIGYNRNFNLYANLLTIEWESHGNWFFNDINRKSSSAASPGHG